MWTRRCLRSRIACGTQTKWPRRSRVRTTRVSISMQYVILLSSYNPTCSLASVLQDELQQELEELEQQQLDDVLAGADHVPVHLPGPPKALPSTSSLYLSSARPHNTHHTLDSQSKQWRKTTRRQSSRSCKRNLRCNASPLAHLVFLAVSGIPVVPIFPLMYYTLGSALNLNLISPPPSHRISCLSFWL